MASRLFAVEAPGDQVLTWYRDTLTSMGYDAGGGGFGGDHEGRHTTEMSFYPPDNLTATVQVHVYHPAPNSRYPVVFEILATYLVPLPRPPEEYLPDDIIRVDVTFGSYGTTTTKEIADATTIQSLVSTVNRLPVLPDWGYMEPPSGCSNVGTTLVFHFQDGRTKKVRILREGCPSRVEFESYPYLHDARNVLSEAAQRAIGLEVEERGTPIVPSKDNVPTRPP